MKFNTGDIIIHTEKEFIARVISNLDNGLLEISFGLSPYSNDVDSVVPESEFELESVFNSELKDALIED